MAKPGSPIFKCVRRHEVHTWFLISLFLHLWFIFLSSIHELDYLLRETYNMKNVVSLTLFFFFTIFCKQIGSCKPALSIVVSEFLSEHFLLQHSSYRIRIALLQVVYGDVYMLDDGARWNQVSPMPKPDSHIEFAWVVVNNSIVIVGGTTEKHPITKKMILVGEVFRFDLETLVCSSRYFFLWMSFYEFMTVLLLV